MVYQRILWCLALFAGGYILPACQDANGSSSELNFDEEKERAAIMKVIEEETDCFFSRNYDCWAEQFTHTDYSYQAWSNADGTFDASVGWDAIEKNLGKYIKENPLEEEEAGSSHPVVIRKNIKVKFYGKDAAHLTWDQYNSSRNQEYFLHSKEVRLMEKPKGDHWKIVNVSAFWDYVNKVPFGEMQEQ
ncbi:hypothetical protein LAG90_09580 [Marinilongibacter aquaticus]|uniref:hypothetical protein n=1 Tax=Marinilongibacter aquaticus TaxID=2975157 RepID=UPI0021BDBF33|nr:hypothetical protein [Marinilongibacter aquaticus]UBM60882.1 hypothetical protein LAG90_09580 [Marinilongibacter aquaticus]